MKYLAAPAALLLFSACSVSLEAPDDAVILCDSDAACPANFQCELSVGRCFDTRVSLPRVFVEPVARGFGAIALSITLADSDGDPATVTAEYDLGSGYAPATLVGATDLPTSRLGTRHVITWNASADLGTSAYRTDVRLRLVANSSEGRGAAVETELFAVGDDAPVASNVAVQGSGPLGGNIIISFDVADSSSDPIAIAKLEVSYDGTFADAVVIFDDASSATADVLPSGSVTDLASTPEGTTHAFTWASTATSIVDTTTAALRLTLRDQFLVSAPANSSTFHLRNQLPPRVANLVSPAAGTHRAAGPLPFSYRLIDENGEPASVVFEYTVDGIHYSPCAEYPAPESEGTTNLATASEAVGGVEHIFIWDPTPLRESAVAVRARAATPTDTGQSVALPRGAGPPFEGAYETLVAAGTVSTGYLAVLAIGDFNGDGLTDLTFPGAYGGPGENDNVAYGCAPVGCLGGMVSSSDTAPAASVVSMAAADLNEDGTDDTIIVRDSVYVRLSTGTTRGAAVVASQAVSGKALTADFDGDGHADLALLRANDVAVMFGDGLGALSAPVFTAASGTQGFALAHVNGDNASDLYVVYGGHFAIFASTGNRASPFGVIDSPVPATQYFAACDLNRDGLSDLVVSGVTVSSVLEYVFESTTELRGPFAVGVNVGGLHALGCADFDGDGASDLAVSDNVLTSNKAQIAFNVGQSDGVADFGELTPFAQQTGDPLDVMVTRTRRDGIGMIAVGTSNQVLPVTLGGAAQITGMSTGMLDDGHELGASGTAYVSLAIADFTGDGIEDYLFNDGDQRLQLWRGTGVRGLASGALTNATTIAIASAGNLLAGDANADGRADLWANGQLHHGHGDGTFVPPIAAASPPNGFRGIPIIDTAPPAGHADFDGDGTPDSVINGDGSMSLGRGTLTGPPGTGAFDPYDPYPDSFSTVGPFASVELSPYNRYFVADINDDGVPDVIQSSRRNLTTFATYFGQVEQTAQRTRAIAPFTSAPRDGAPVTATAADLVGARVAFHVARGTPDDVFLWEDSLIAQGVYATTDTQRPLTVPYELHGEVRLTAASPVTSSTPPLVADPRLTLDTAARGLVLDLPVIAGNEGAINDASNRVFVRVTDYDGLATGAPRRRSTWIEIPKAPGNDLAMGTGRRYATAPLGSGYVIRVLTDRGGIFVSFTP